MKETVTLNKPLLVNGENLTMLPYDTDEITGALYCAAEARKAAAMHQSGVSVGNSIDPTLMVAETNGPLQLYVGYAAVLAVNPQLDWSDLERITGSDINTFRKIGRFFLKGSAGPRLETSDEPSETMQESSTPTDTPLNDDE